MHNMIAGVEKFMQRRVIKICLAIFVVVGILVGLLAVMSRDSGPEMSFGFLSGRTLTARIEQDPGRSAYRTTREVYSFEADFNDVCAKIDAELSALGFTRLMLGPQEPRRREYMLRKNSSIERINVRLIDKHKLLVYSTPKSSKYSTPDRHEYHWRNGWVSVEIAPRRLRSWPPQYFLIRLQLMLRRVANKPPAQNKNASPGH